MRAPVRGPWRGRAWAAMAVRNPHPPEPEVFGDAMPVPSGGAVPRAQRHGCIKREGTSEAPQKRLDRQLEVVAKAVGGGYCRLQMPLKLALAVRETVAGH